MCLVNKHPFRADKVPDSVLDAGVLWMHEPRFWPQATHALMGQRQAQRRDTCPPELGLATTQTAEKIQA